jgi:tRNA(fMet)-specific endonuclease VapC
MPDIYLLDTNILVHLVRGDHAGEEIKAKYAPYTKDPKPFICAVTDGELRSLSLLFSWGPLKMNKMSFAIDYFGRVPIESRDVMEAYAAIDYFSKSQGIKMGKNDVWIASAAYTSGARLVTTDDDFDHLDPAFVSVDKIRLA